MEPERIRHLRGDVGDAEPSALDLLSVAAEPGSNARSTDRVLDVLVYLASRANPAPATMIGRACGLPRSSAYHVLNALRRRNFVTYYSTERRWGLGLAAFEIGSAYLRSEPLERLGRPLIRDLSRKLGLVTHLAVLHGANVLYLSREIPATARFTRDVAFEVGVRVPAHLTAVGRAMLMCLPPRQLDALMPVTRSLPGRLGAGVYLRSQLDRELSEARPCQYAAEDDMIVSGVGCIAAPVRSYEGYAMAAVGVSFLKQDFGSKRRTEVAAEIVDAARVLSQKLGWSTPRAAT